MDNEDLVPEDAVSVVLDGAKLFIPMDELVDFEKELERLTKEKDKLESEIKKSCRKALIIKDSLQKHLKLL